MHQHQSQPGSGALEIACCPHDGKPLDLKPTRHGWQYVCDYHGVIPDDHVDYRANDEAA